MICRIVKYILAIYGRIKCIFANNVFKRRFEDNNKKKKATVVYVKKLIYCNDTTIIKLNLGLDHYPTEEIMLENL